MTTNASTPSWTPGQQRAIASRERTLVAAAAGSGKTSVLTELIVGALARRELSPADVCAVTFTEKAAQEMRSRIAHRLDQLGEHDVLASLELARIGTIHSLCAWILRRHGAAVGIDPRISILDEAQAAWLERGALRRALQELGDDADVQMLRSRISDDAIIQLLRDVHGCALQGDGSIRLVEPAQVGPVLSPRSGDELLSAAECAALQRALHVLWHRVRSNVEEGKRQLGRISFDDLERLAVSAVRDSAVLTSLRAQWSFVLVDEFQDTNARQYEILDAIGSDRLFMVGDEWQSIYRFRGADIDVFRARREEAGSRLIPMRENFRSDGPVLEVVNRLFAHPELFGSRYEAVHPGSDRQRDAHGPAVELLVVPETDSDEHLPARGSSAREREAQRVAERVAQLIEQGDAEPGDIAILYARGTGIELYESALRAWGLPVMRSASGGFYDQRDVRDALAVLALVRNPRDDHAALTVLAGPIAKLEWTELDEVVQAARESSISLLTAAGESQLPGALRVAHVVSMLQQHARTATLVEIVDRVVALAELELGASLAPDGVVRLANLRRLVELAASASQVNVRDVAGLLEFVEAQRRDARIGEAGVADEHAGAVRLMTIHAAKGLEFRHVFVIEASAAATSRPALTPVPLVDAAGVVHVGLPTSTGTFLTTAAYDACRELDQIAAREERLRLWYVAMTRACNRLYISGHWNFEPTKAGAPRALPGALRWLVPSLELPAHIGPADSVTRTLDGLVVVDTRPARRVPSIVWSPSHERVHISPPRYSAPDGPIPLQPTSPEPGELEALRARLRSSVHAPRGDDWRLLAGTRVHDAVARLLESARSGVAADQLLDPEQGPWLTDHVRDRLRPIVSSDVFRRLLTLDARVEVPYVAGRGDVVASRATPGVQVAASLGDVDAGRIDALARLEDGGWWIVDWKSTLAPDPHAAWNAHGSQLRRYADVAIAAGAPYAVVTLVPLDRPHEPLTWTLPGLEVDPADRRSEPDRCALP